jgi:hypothetical protein
VLWTGSTKYQLLGLVADALVDQVRVGVRKSRLLRHARWSREAKGTYLHFINMDKKAFYQGDLVSWR